MAVAAAATIVRLKAVMQTSHTQDIETAVTEEDKDYWREGSRLARLRE
jgi:hypothetical protein